MLKAFSASNPVPVHPATFPDNTTLRDGIIDGTYTIAYYNQSADQWLYLRADFQQHYSDMPPYWDFLWEPMVVSGPSICLTRRAVVKSAGVPELGAEIFDDGKSNLHDGDHLYMGFWIKTS